MEQETVTYSGSPAGARALKAMLEQGGYRVSAVSRPGSPLTRGAAPDGYERRNGPGGGTVAMLAATFVVSAVAVPAGTALQALLEEFNKTWLGIGQARPGPRHAARTEEGSPRR